MPCTDGGPSYNDFDRVNNQVKKLSQMLCYVCQHYHKGTKWSKVLGDNRQLDAWWDAHQLEDKRRLEKEAADAALAKAREKALAKLTKKERNLLGFNGE